MPRAAPIEMPPDIALRLLDEVSRTRHLTTEETDLLERLICRGHKSAGVRIRWTATLDRKLAQAAHSKGAIQRFAEQQGITPMAAYSRLRIIRRGKA